MQRLRMQEKVLQLSENVPPPPGALCYLASHKKGILRFHVGLYERWYRARSEPLPACYLRSYTDRQHGHRSGKWGA